MKLSDKIRQEAIGLEVNQTERIVCPSCNAKHEKSMTVTRLRQGVIYNCLRASCGKKGFIPSLPGVACVDETKKEFTSKPFLGRTVAIPPSILRRLAAAYDVTTHMVRAMGWKYVPHGNRLFMPLLDARGYVWGAVTKRLPIDWMKATAVLDSGPKVIMYAENDLPKVHIPTKFWGCIKTRPVVVVEDVLSATKLCLYGVPAVAILGTHLAEREALHLADIFGERGIIMALDADATLKAKKMVRDWGLYFNTACIIVNEKDPKDMTKEEIWGKYGETDTECAVPV